MITIKDLDEAIMECQGVRNPNAGTCMKLASYLTIKDHMEEKAVNENNRQIPPPQSYSFASGNDAIYYTGESEFAKIINGRKPEDVWPIIDELVGIIEVMLPRLYDGLMRKLHGLN